jgi:tetratricopeptide (TPR) repeat protein
MRVRSRRHRRHVLPIQLSTYFEQELGGWLFEPLAIGTLKDTDFQIAFCESILAQTPDHTEALALLGEAYTARGDFEKGLQTDLHLSRLKPCSNAVHYNLACSYALMGRRDEALGALRRALELGYSDREHLCNDRDLQSLREDPRYQALIDQWPVGK